MAVHDVMSRDEERDAATRIATLRRSYWDSILSYPSFVPGILDLVEDTLGAGTGKKKKLPREAMDALRKASRSLRDRDLVKHQKAFETAKVELAEKMARLDLDGDCSEQILADLNTILAGQGHPLMMNVKLPRKGS
ncbi:MAG: hypothetical protein R3A79_11535, partial [Nannocystaceae bacterium]